MDVVRRELLSRTVLTKTGIPGYDWCLNPYVGCEHGCSYCYASFMKRFTGHLEPWGAFVDAKVNAPEALRRQLRRIRGGSVLVGTVTDPYQPLERTRRLTRGCLEALAELGSPDARELVREFVTKKVELLADPTALRGVLKVVEAGEIPDILGRFLTALQWRGAHRAGEGFRTLLEALQIDDAGWCFRTGPSGRIELRKTIKAVESGYDCDILAAMGEAMKIRRLVWLLASFASGTLLNESVTKMR